MRNKNEKAQLLARLSVVLVSAIVALLVVSPVALAMQYEYDALNRLTKVIYDDGKVVIYTYDAVGNRMSKKVFTAVPADFDLDGDVDLNDFAAFQLCFNGPDQPPAPLCAANADFDTDVDVDFADFATFQAAFAGS